MCRPRTAVISAASGGSEDRFRNIDGDKAEAAAQGALRKLEEDRRAAFDRALRAGERALEAGLVPPELPEGLAERFAAATTADELMAIVDTSGFREVLENSAAAAAEDSRFRSLEFSLEEIEEDLLQKVRAWRGAYESHVLALSINLPSARSDLLQERALQQMLAQLEMEASDKECGRPLNHVGGMCAGRGELNPHL